MIALLSLVLLCFDLPACPTAYQSLISQLGSRSYRSREAAESQLRLAFPASRCALALAVASDDPEVSSRARRLLGAMLEPGACPWLDMAYPDGRMRAWQKEYLARAGCVDGRGPDWPNYRFATREWIGGLLRAGVRREWVEALLAGMRGREGEYRRKHGLSMSGSAE